MVDPRVDVIGLAKNTIIDHEENDRVKLVTAGQRNGLIAVFRATTRQTAERND